MAEKQTTQTKTAPGQDRGKNQNDRQKSGGFRRGGQNNKPQRRFQQSAYDQKVLDIARVGRMTAGGRRFSFRAMVVVGDRKGRVGIGVAKGADVSIAIQKAARSAEKNTIQVPMTPKGTVPYETQAKQTGSVVVLRPAKEGRGIIAGGAVRVVCDLAGYKDITAKILSRSTNKLNNAHATIKALQQVRYEPPAAPKKETKDKKINKKDAKPSDKKTKTS